MNPLLAPDGRLRAIWRFVLGLLLVLMANSFAAGLAFRFGSPGSRSFDFVYRPAAMAFLLAGFSLLLVALDRVRHPLRAMGLGFPWKRETTLGLSIGAGMVVIAVACVAVAGELRFALTINGRVLARVLVTLFILATAAMAEELAFRGYPFQRLVESLGAWPAVILMSVPFGAVHLANPHASPYSLINTILLGVLFSVAYLRTRALWLPFGIHLGWNAMLGLVLGLPVSGLNEFAVLVRGSGSGAAVADRRQLRHGSQPGLHRRRLARISGDRGFCASRNPTRAGSCSLESGAGSSAGSGCWRRAPSGRSSLSLP